MDADLKREYIAKVKNGTRKSTIEARIKVGL
jgi:hypothetical protein